MRKNIYNGIILLIIALVLMPNKVYAAQFAYYKCDEYEIKQGTIANHKILSTEKYCGDIIISPTKPNIKYCRGVRGDFTIPIYTATVNFLKTVYTVYGDNGCTSVSANTCEELPVEVCVYNSTKCEVNTSTNKCFTKTNSCKVKLSSSSSTITADGKNYLVATASFTNCGNTNEYTLGVSGGAGKITCTKSGLNIYCKSSAQDTANITITKENNGKNYTTGMTVTAKAPTAPEAGCYYCNNNCEKKSAGSSIVGCVKDSGNNCNANCEKQEKVLTSGCYLCNNGNTCVYIKAGEYLGSCAKDNSNKCQLNGTSCTKSGGGDGSEKPINPSNPDPTITVNAYRYALTGAGYQGDSIACGDKLYISTCDDNYCNVTNINGKNVSTTTKVYKNKIKEIDTTSTCTNMTKYIKQTDYYYSDQDLTLGATQITCGSEVKFTKSPGDACTSKSCQVSYNNKTIFVKKDLIVSTKPTCSNVCVSSKPVTGLKGETTIRICYVYKNGEITEQDMHLKDAVTCADGYSKTSPNMISDSDTCKDNVQVCSKDYRFNCTLAARPGMSASGGVAGINGKGIITFEAKDNSTDGIKGYYMSQGTAPTVKADWIPFNNNDYKGSLSLSAGTYFFWSMTNSNRISYAVMSKVHDTEPTTTISLLNVKAVDTDENVSITPLNDGGTLALADKDMNYVMLSNTLKNDSVLAAFDSYTTGYEVTVKANKIAVYATLTSSDAAYVPGYEPRTVNLDYGRNVILIKIVNKKGRERTYTIIANRVDDRENDNLLSSLTISKGRINFDPYVSDYTVEVPKNTSEVTINGTLQSAKSAFVAGYAPRKVTLSNEVTSAVIKTISEAGITRSYVITFVKSGSEVDKTITNSVYLSSLSIPGTKLEFDRDNNSYSISIGYEIEELPVYAFAESANATVTIRGNQNFKVGPNVIEIEVRNGNKTKVYTVYVNRKESGLEVGSSTSLATLTIKDYDINFKPDVLDYVVKIKREKTLLITATPYNNRSEVYMVGNNDLTGFSTVRIKVIAEDGATQTYSVDIQKDAFDKQLELYLSIGAGVIILSAAIIIVVLKQIKKKKEYIEN